MTFTGSTSVGKILYRKSVETVKRPSLELGGHAPLIVFDDADLEVAVREAIACKYRNSGQTCVCTNRIYVQRGIAEAFTKAFAAASDRPLVGDPSEDATDIGPVAPIAVFDNGPEIVRLANDTPYGLSAYVFTNDLSRAHRMAEALDHGIVGLNDGVPSTPQAPFGGIKQSGIGREEGKWGPEEYLEVKYVSGGLR